MVVSIKSGGYDLNTYKSGLSWLAIVTTFILLIPLIAMQFTHEVNWNKSDFIVMGLLCVSLGSLYVLASKLAPQRRLLAGIVLSVILIYIWAELAVGIFTQLGS